MICRLALVLSALLAFGEAKGVFYAFTGDGIEIIDPSRMLVTKRIPHDTKLPGTQDKMCTSNPRKRTKCSWAGTANVDDKYVYAADSKGNRLIVIDAVQHVPVKAIQTKWFPYQVTYIAALDEVWVLCWKNNVLNVVGRLSDGQTEIHKISNASSLEIVHSIQAHNVKYYKHEIHSILEAENCQNIDPNLQYGIVTHFSEPGIHKIDLKNKRHHKFINTSSIGCKATFGLAYSSVKNYAFVQCLGYLVGNKKNQMLVIDMETDLVVYAGDSITDKATGYPYSSPDGKFVTVLNPNMIITYYMKSRTAKIVRMPNLNLTNFSPSKVTFVNKGNGYLAYVTSKTTDKILVIEMKEPVSRNSLLETWFINGVGYAADFSTERIASIERYYHKWYKQILQKTRKPFTEAAFKQYIRAMYSQHVVRRISSGCGLNDRYVASPSASNNSIVIIDGKTRTMLGQVKGLQNARSALWVNQN